MFGVQALTSRVVIVPHRSKFQLLPSREPLTFVANTDIKSKFISWYPYMMRWCVAGLLRYHDVGFVQIPQSCLAFKAEIMDEKDVVKDWLSRSVQTASEDDFVKFAELWQKFEKDNKELQRDKKTKKSNHAFERELNRCLGAQHFKDRHHFKVDGNKKTAGKVFMTYKWADEMEA